VVLVVSVALVVLVILVVLLVLILVVLVVLVVVEGRSVSVEELNVLHQVPPFVTMCADDVRPWFLTIVDYGFDGF
jgi:flagellar basal body-associated protein FliL